ncbi:MAG TPA: Glu/Leu/Phe/Val dehydrogenase dimerization domain-containing protein [Acidimicrobiales bacterium]|nr:Glu/Leu/Phe/Val dehydrogenase dimerization domain-containing protein [Acidimicrobiales bacterium]
MNVPEEYEEVVSCDGAIVSVHSTVLGPALGGVRYRPYPSEEAALEDVLRLSKAMTYKAAVAGLDYGGGKAVIVGDPHAPDRTERLAAFARCVDSLGGRYLTAEDMGTTQADMDFVRTITPYVTGTSQGSGDPSPPTALGVFCAITATAESLWGSADLAGRHVVVQGVGKVGRALVGHLLGAGCRVTVADVVPAATAIEGVDVVDPARVHAVPCDVFSPCALGGVLSPATIPELACTAVVGSANNQLVDDACADLLRDRGVLYVPDYVANAGGIVNIAQEPGGYDRARADAAVRRIHDTVLQVLTEADRQGVTPLTAATRIAEARLRRPPTA